MPEAVPAGQVIESRDLGAGGRQQGLLRTAARHRAGTKIRYEAPRPEYRRCAYLDGIDIHEPGEALGGFLHERGGERGGRRGAGLACRQQQHRHSAANRRLEAKAGVVGKFERRHDEAVRLTDERTRAPLVLSAGDEMEHLEARLDVLRLYPARTHVFGGAGDARIGGVDIHFKRSRDLAAHDRALKEMKVLERVDHARDVVQILGRRVAVDAGRRIDDVHGSACGAEIDPRSPWLHVVLRILAVQHEVPRSPGHGVLDQRARKNQPPGGVELRPRLGHVLDAAGSRVGEPNVFQHVERSMMDSKHVGVGQRLVQAARHARADRAQVVG